MYSKFNPKSCSSRGTQSGRPMVDMVDAIDVVGVVEVVDLAGNVNGFSGIGYS